MAKGRIYRKLAPYEINAIRDATSKYGVTLKQIAETVNICQGQISKKLAGDQELRTDEAKKPYCI